jgi:predicted ATPase
MQPELLAHHYTEAGLVGQAVPYWQRAGQRALQRSANVEAIRHLTKGLDLLQPLPNTPEHARQELTFQITLGAALVVTRGYAAPEVAQAYTRARELCQQLGEIPQLFPVLWGLWNFYLGRELRMACELAEQLLSLAQRVQDPVLLLEAHDALGQTFSCLGELAPARPHLEKVIALYDRQQHHSLAFLYGGEDPGVTCLYHAARILWSLGYQEQALGRSHEALTLAQELSHPNSLAIALGVAAMVHHHRREGQAAQERAEALIKLATEQEAPYWVGYGTALRGWALAEQGQEDEGIAQVRRGIAIWQETGTEIGRTYFLALLAEAYGKAGQADKGLAALADAPASVEKTGDRRWEAELYRLRGELMLAQSRVQRVESRVKEAEECFHKAIEIAHKQQAKSLELRAATSLARFWQQQGKTKEAHEMLSGIYGWFTEGFDTKDLQEAKALIDSLESSVLSPASSQIQR